MGHEIPNFLGFGLILSKPYFFPLFLRLLERNVLDLNGP